VTWLLADYFGGVKYSAPFYYYWNSTIHFLAFIINAVTIARIKSDLDQRQVLAAELEASREKLRAVSALLPTCPRLRQAASGRRKQRGRRDGEACPGAPRVGRHSLRRLPHQRGQGGRQCRIPRFFVLVVVIVIALWPAISIARTRTRTRTIAAKPAGWSAVSASVPLAEIRESRATSFQNRRE